MLVKFEDGDFLLVDMSSEGHQGTGGYFLLSKDRTDYQKIGLGSANWVKGGWWTVIIGLNPYVSGRFHTAEEAAQCLWRERYEALRRSTPGDGRYGEIKR